MTAPTTINGVSAVAGKYTAAPAAAVDGSYVPVLTTSTGEVCIAGGANPLPVVPVAVQTTFTPIRTFAATVGDAAGTPANTVGPFMALTGVGLPGATAEFETTLIATTNAPTSVTLTYWGLVGGAGGTVIHLATDVWSAALITATTPPRTIRAPLNCSHVYVTVSFQGGAAPTVTGTVQCRPIEPGAVSGLQASDLSFDTAKSLNVVMPGTSVANPLAVKQIPAVESFTTIRTLNATTTDTDPPANTVAPFVLLAGGSTPNAFVEFQTTLTTTTNSPTGVVVRYWGLPIASAGTVVYLGQDVWDVSDISATAFPRVFRSPISCSHVYATVTFYGGAAPTVSGTILARPLSPGAVAISRDAFDFDDLKRLRTAPAGYDPVTDSIKTTEQRPIWTQFFAQKIVLASQNNATYTYYFDVQLYPSWAIHIITGASVTAVVYGSMDADNIATAATYGATPLNALLSQPNPVPASSNVQIFWDTNATLKYISVAVTGAAGVGANSFSVLLAARY